MDETQIVKSIIWIKQIEWIRDAAKNRQRIILIILASLLLFHGYFNRFILSSLGDHPSSRRGDVFILMAVAANLLFFLIEIIRADWTGLSSLKFYTMKLKDFNITETQKWPGRQFFTAVNNKNDWVIPRYGHTLLLVLVLFFYVRAVMKYYSNFESRDAW